MATGSAHRTNPLKHRKYSHMPVVDFNPVDKYLSELEVKSDSFLSCLYEVSVCVILIKDDGKLGTTL